MTGIIRMPKKTRDDWVIRMTRDRGGEGGQFPNASVLSCSLSQGLRW